MRVADESGRRQESCERAESRKIVKSSDREGTHVVIESIKWECHVLVEDSRREFLW